ncbi:MAG: 50S ribosomal protein L22 [Clostridia bacterium]|nr:50S ribosomal protein L22 [Clostridia bacterium]
MLSKRERKVLGIGRDQGKATLNYARISARKVKIVLDLIRDKSLEEAYAIVRFTPKAASELIYKLLKSAEANAVNNFELDGEKLYVAECFANQGPTLKRMRAASRGRGMRINKRTSNITVVLKERD